MNVVSVIELSDCCWHRSTEGALRRTTDLPALTSAALADALELEICC